MRMCVLCVCVCMCVLFVYGTSILAAPGLLKPKMIMGVVSIR